MAIGGVGGSGTRLIARLLMELGFFMGGDLNEVHDNLWFTLLFKRPEILSLPDDEFRELAAIFVARMTGARDLSAGEAERVRRLAESDMPQYPPVGLKLRAESLLNGPPAPPDGPWGWKEPNTHIVMDRLPALLPGMKYIHVMRNGLDMAHSANQNQLQLWGPHFVGPEVEVSPYFSLKYWHVVHRRIRDVGARLGERFLLLNYDRFCAQPAEGVRGLLGFLETSRSPAEVDELAGLVKHPASIGRFKEHGIDVFDPADVAFVATLGFDTKAS